MSMTTIGRARIRTQQDPITARRACARVLAGLDLSPAALPPSAILIVRRLASPIAVQDPNQRSSQRAPVGRSREVEAALRSELERALTTAARVVKGRVDASSDAVLFADAAELLAVLLLDAARGAFPHAWYWREVGSSLGLELRHGHDGPARAWTTRPRAVPGAVEALVTWRRLDDAARQIDDTTSKELLLRLESEFGLPAGLARTAFQRHASAQRTPHRRDPDGRDTGAGSPALAAEDRAPELGAEPVRSTEPTPQLALFAVARAIERARGRTRSAQEWGALVSLAFDEIGPVTSATARSSAHAELQHDTAGTTSLPRQRHDVRPTRRVGTVANETSRTDRPSRTAAIAPGADTAPHAIRDEPGLEPAPERAATIDWRPTRLGGAFYLLNATDPWETDTPVDSAPPGPAAWTELVARELFPEERDQDDELWTALARLDGRDPAEGLPAELFQTYRERVHALTRDLAARIGARDTIELQDELRVPARFVLTRTHLDVVFPIDSISLAVRRSGLDRDPGWIPALQRVVTFHFR